MKRVLLVLSILLVLSTCKKEDDPTVTINVGDTVNFAVNASGHPFYLKTVAGTGTGNTISGVTNNGTSSGSVS